MQFFPMKIHSDIQSCDTAYLIYNYGERHRMCTHSKAMSTLNLLLIIAKVAKIALM